MRSKKSSKLGIDDIDAVTLRIGGVKLDDAVPLGRGNKFVIAEQLIDPNENPVASGLNDVRKICFSLFSSPVPIVRGRHYQVLMYHDADTCGIRGGGDLMVNRHGNVSLNSYSGDYGSEPAVLRTRFEELLPDVLRTSFPEQTLETKGPLYDETDPQRFCDSHTSTYWFRFKQVYEAARQVLSSSDFRNKTQYFEQEFNR